MRSRSASVRAVPGGSRSGHGRYFGISVLSGVAGLYRNSARCAAATIARCLPGPSTAPRRAASSCAPPARAATRRCPPDPASVAAVVARLGSLQFDPLDVTGRNHDLVLAARIDGYRRAWTDDALYRERWLYEAYNKGLSLLPTAELPWYRVIVGPVRRRARRRDLRGARRPRRRAPRPDHARRPAVVDRRRAARRDRLVLAADQPGPGRPRGPRPGRRARASPDATATSASTTSPSGSSPPTCSASARRRTSSAATSSCRATAPTACSGGRGGQQEIWLGAAPTAAERYRHRDALIEAGALVPVDGRGREGRAAGRSPGELPLLDAAEASVAAGEPASPGVAFLAPLDPLAWDRDLLRSACSTSTTSGRSTSRRRSGAGATTSCRCCGATGSSVGSSRGSTARRGP